MAQTTLKSSPPNEILTASSYFRCFDVFPLCPPKKLQFQVKISGKRPVFTNYLSVSYDYKRTPEGDCLSPISDVDMGEGTNKSKLLAEVYLDPVDGVCLQI